MPVKKENQEKPRPRKCVCGKEPVLVSIRGGGCLAALTRSTVPGIFGRCGRSRRSRRLRNGMVWWLDLAQGGDDNGQRTVCVQEV